MPTINQTRNRDLMSTSLGLANNPTTQTLAALGQLSISAGLADQPQKCVTSRFTRNAEEVSLFLSSRRVYAN